MALTDSTTFQAVAEAIGAADNNIQSTLDLNTSSSAASKVKVARQEVNTASTTATDSEFDDVNTFETSLRTLEKSMVTIVQPAVAAAITACQTFIYAQTGSNFRDYYNSTASNKTFTSNTNFEYFRTAWRRVRSEELIVRIGSITKASGSWPASLTADKSFTLPTYLEVRTGSLIGAAAITINLVCVKADATSDLITLTIPAATASGTRYSIGSTTKYVSISSVALTGGTNADVVEVWLR